MRNTRSPVFQSILWHELCREEQLPAAVSRCHVGYQRSIAYRLRVLSSGAIEVDASDGAALKRVSGGHDLSVVGICSRKVFEPLNMIRVCVIAIEPGNVDGSSFETI